MSKVKCHQLPTTSSVHYGAYSYQVTSISDHFWSVAFKMLCRQTHRCRQKQYLLAARAQVKIAAINKTKHGNIINLKTLVQTRSLWLDTETTKRQRDRQTERTDRPVLTAVFFQRTKRVDEFTDDGHHWPVNTRQYRLLLHRTCTATQTDRQP